MTPQRCLCISYAFTLLFLLQWSGHCRGAERQIEPIPGLVASMVKAYGGSEAVGRVVSIEAKGRITEFLNGKAGTYVRYLERPGKLRIEVMPEQGGEIRILNGNKGWQGGSGGLSPVSPLELQAMIYQFSYLDLPMAFVDGTFQVKYGGRESVNGRPAFLLVGSKSAPPLHILVDSETRLISRVSARFAMGMMGNGELATEYSDFRPVMGVLFPFRLINYAGDLKLSEIDLDEIILNKKIPPKIFAPR